MSGIYSKLNETFFLVLLITNMTIDLHAIYIIHRKKISMLRIWNKMPMVDQISETSTSVPIQGKAHLAIIRVQRKTVLANGWQKQGKERKTAQEKDKHLQGKKQEMKQKLHKGAEKELRIQMANTRIKYYF